MKIVALHTDFRIYWPARLKALYEALNKRGDTLDVRILFRKRRNILAKIGIYFFRKKSLKVLTVHKLKRNCFPY